MPVTIKKKAWNLETLVKRLFDAEVGTDLLTKAAAAVAAGYKLSMTPKTFVVSIGDKVVATQPLKTEAVALAMKGQLGMAVKTSIRDKVKHLILDTYNNLLTQNIVDGVVGEKIYMEKIYMDPMSAYEDVMKKYFGDNNGHNKVAAIKHLRMLCGLSLKQAKDMVEGWLDAFPEAPADDIEAEAQAEGDYFVQGSSTLKAMDLGKKDWTVEYSVKLKDTPVPLKEATQLHQPVCGTSGGSIYHTIAMNGDLVVAARITNENSVSLRAESTAHPNSTEGQKIKAALLAAGLDKKGGGHYSLHLEPDSRALAIKSVGALLFAMQYEFAGVSTNVGAIIGAGK